MYLSRRSFTALAIGALTSTVLSRSLFAQAPNFDALFNELLANEALLEKTQTYGREKEELLISRGTVSSRKKSTRAISKRAIDLIIAFEVTGKTVYEKKYKGVIRPGGASGATWGIGYDGGYVSPQNVREDWQGLISDADIKDLSKTCGVTGPAANQFKSSLSHIQIGWDVAIEQFKTRVLPIYVAATLDALKNADALSDDSLGALVSLVYNRGPSFRLVGPRYEEMRHISKLMAGRKFSEVPSQFMSMQRLWTAPDVIGVAKRRQLEALLFTEGLKT
ncbi:hypothetical protein SAMN03159423_2121 [Bradyrhizobium sp. NFR13]|uniref:hypothetical protein n=1 Tax=Bradyrhizobium sp. NFR13 TaxID=1566285 RepID=UPI0008EA67A1|nr:hypothetical protein [Bradyrhizobium sp. NFR13]SFL50910.1 hypothetical protein SAMN03159423_2121 [Bradyrhizobium sp. NFR13]